MSDDVKREWARIEKWIAERRPAGGLLTPAAKDALDELMDAYGGRIPEAWVTSVSIHDGDLAGVFGDVTAASVADATEMADEIGGDEWPVGTTETGDALCIDREGRVVEASSRKLVAESFAAWLRACADGLEGLLWHPIHDEVVSPDRFPDFDVVPSAVGDATALTEALTKALLARGERVELPGLGTFTVSERRAFTGHNPLTGERMDVPARRIPVFRAASALRCALNGGVPDDDDEPASRSVPAWASGVMSPAAMAALVTSVSSTLVAGGVVGWLDVGEFSVSKRRAYEPSYAQTEEDRVAPARSIPVFRAYPALKDRLNP